MDRLLTQSTEERKQQVINHSGNVNRQVENDDPSTGESPDSSIVGHMAMDSDASRHHGGGSMSGEDDDEFARLERYAEELDRLNNSRETVSPSLQEDDLSEGDTALIEHVTPSRPTLDSTDGDASSDDNVALDRTISDLLRTAHELDCREASRQKSLEDEESQLSVTDPSQSSASDTGSDDDEALFGELLLHASALDDLQPGPTAAGAAATPRAMADLQTSSVAPGPRAAAWLFSPGPTISETDSALESSVGDEVTNPKQEVEKLCQEASELVLQNKDEEALRLLEQAVAIDPENSELKVAYEQLSDRPVATI